MVNVNNENISFLFDFSYPIFIHKLEESINRVGQLLPILAIKMNNTLFVIDGFRRYHITKRLGINPTIFLLPPLEIRDALYIYLELNSYNRELNSIEKIRICNFIKDKGIKLPNTVVKNSRLGDIYTNSNLKEFIEKLDDTDKNTIVEKHLNISLINNLSQMDLVNTKRILRIIKDLSLTHQEARELITDLYLIYKRGCKIEEIINDSHILRFEQIREKIKAIKNPVLLNMEYDFKKFTERFSNVLIKPPENYEGDDYKIEATIRDKGEIDYLITTLIKLKEEWDNNPILK